MNIQSPLPRRARRGSGAVTLHDVARLAGVAPITASRALNTPAQVSPEVLQKVTWPQWFRPSPGRCSCRPCSRSRKRWPNTATN